MLFPAQIVARKKRSRLIDESYYSVTIETVIKAFIKHLQHLQLNHRQKHVQDPQLQRDDDILNHSTYVIYPAI